ncbi:hypothetical protein [Hoeflea sp. AS16]|uniref:hypothetical protein n=1 Tax=Hoeflea sp. AS16 TaxID=3135779 RepID=UPI0031723980
MGGTSRVTHAIDPGAGDLLMPGRGRKLDAARRRDVEDACFEPVSAPRDVFSARPRDNAANGVFKSRIMQPEADGPIPRDFAGKTMVQGKRLGVFAGSKNGAAPRGLISPLAALALAVCASAAAFWMAGGHALVLPSGSDQSASRVSAPVVSVGKPAASSPDPVVTSSIPAAKARTTEAGFTAPMPRPARIERAGSILMIRPAGD